MAECKHKFQTTGTILCKECGIDLVDYLNSQNEQYEATIKAMRCCGNCEHEDMTKIFAPCCYCDEHNEWQLKEQYKK